MNEVVAEPSLTDSFRERCRRELARALKLLSDPARDRDEVVHESRKSVRRVRAWLRLLSARTRRDLAEVDTKLRSIRRTLGPLRDARSRCEAMDKLRKRRDLGTLRPHLVDARVRFNERLAQRWIRRPREGLAWRRMLSSLTELIENIPLWPLDGVHAKHLQRGVRRAWRNARKMRRECRGRIGAPLRHAWRGRVRILMLQCQLLEQLALFAAPPELKSLGQALGDEHDMAVVSRELAALKLDTKAESDLRAYLRQRRLSMARRNDQLAKRVLGSMTRPMFD